MWAKDHKRLWEELVWRLRGGRGQEMRKARVARVCQQGEERGPGVAGELSRDLTPPCRGKSLLYSFFGVESLVQ